MVELHLLGRVYIFILSRKCTVKHVDTLAVIHIYQRFDLLK